MALINGIIPAQNFETVRDRIGAVLATELGNQFALSGDASANPVVYVERCIAFDKEELPALNVALSRGDYDNKDVTQADGSYLFNIDVYAKSKSNGLAGGDTLARTHLHRMLGMCRAILSNPVYRTLGFTAPSLCRVTVNSVETDAEGHMIDAVSGVMGRLELLVKVPENVALIDTVACLENITTVKLDVTQKGYMYVMNPPKKGTLYFLIDNINRLVIDNVGNKLTLI